MSAIVLEARFGRSLPVFLSIALSMIAVAFLFTPTNTTFIIASSALIFGWNFTYPFQIAAIAEVDSSNRFVPKCVGMMLLGFSAGPLIAAAFINYAGGLAAVKWLAISGFAVAVVLLIPVVGKKPASHHD